MAFDSSKLKKTHVIKAAEILDRGKRKIRVSRIYEVVIEGKRYPPKEIVREAYKLATGEDVGLIYGGSQVNRPLVDLGFEIVIKQKVWKLGCNWGKGSPSFFEFIKSEAIVIGVEKHQFEVGDLVAITEGFTVYAIAEVTKPMKSITTKASYRKPCSEMQIEYEDWVQFGESKWYVLPETEIFIYQLQPGIRRVRNQTIFNRVVDLWENQVAKPTKYYFYSKKRSESIKTNWKFPCLVFTSDNWDDYGFQTTHDVRLYRSLKQRVEIGHVKILQKNRSTTELPTEFMQLDETFCSLGQSLDYYKRLKDEISGYRRVLNALNDCAFNRKIRKDFEHSKGFAESLLRSSEAEMTLNEARKYIEGDKSLRSFQFTFSCRIGKAQADHSVDFEFNMDEILKNRFFCIVGRNGTGKTKFISLLANKLIDEGEPGAFRPSRPQFARVIATSFSYFDVFKQPAKGDISYEFIGIKSQGRILTESETNEIVWEALQKVFKEKKKKNLWLKCMNEALEVDYLNFRLEELQHISTKKEFREATIDISSSGQNIVFQFITRFIAAVTDNSLLVYDEPETHLHPNIAGRLLRTLKHILDETKSYCVLSTHSPIIVQEVPSRFIRIFDRQSDTPVIYPPTIECLGENLSIISNSIFEADHEKELYKTELESLLGKYTLEQIKTLFDGKLSLNANLYLQSVADKE